MIKFPPGIGHDFSFHDAGRSRPGLPIFPMAMDAAPEPEPLSDYAFDADDVPDEPEPRKNKVNAQQLLEAVAAMVKKGMSSDDVIDALMKMRGGTDDPTSGAAGAAMDRAHRRTHDVLGNRLPVRTTPAAAVARTERFPNAGRPRLMQARSSARPKLVEPAGYDTPERAELALAIAANAATADSLARISAAETQLRDNWRTARDKAEAAAEVVETAKDAASAYALASAMGDAGSAPVTVKAARQALQDAEDEAEAAKTALDALGARTAEAGGHATDAASRVRKAALAVLMTSPAVATMADRLYQAQRDLVEVGGAFLWLAGQNAWPVVEAIGSQYGRPVQGRLRALQNNLYQPAIHWHELVAEHGGARHWIAALAALEADAHAEYRSERHSRRLHPCAAHRVRPHDRGRRQPQRCSRTVHRGRRGELRHHAAGGRHLPARDGRGDVRQCSGVDTAALGERAGGVLMVDVTETLPGAAEPNAPVLEIDFAWTPPNVPPDDLLLSEPDLVERREVTGQVLLYRSLRTVVR